MHGVGKLEFTGDYAILAQKLEDREENLTWQQTAYKQLLCPVRGMYFKMN